MLPAVVFVLTNCEAYAFCYRLLLSRTITILKKNQRLQLWNQGYVVSQSSIPKVML
eukprot:jgi/Phyca11/110417/e_gw1.18.556.1